MTPAYVVPSSTELMVSVSAYAGRGRDVPGVPSHCQLPYLVQRSSPVRGSAARGHPVRGLLHCAASRQPGLSLCLCVCLSCPSSIQCGFNRSRSLAVAAIIRKLQLQTCVAAKSGFVAANMHHVATLLSAAGVEGSFAATKVSCL